MGLTVFAVRRCVTGLSVVAVLSLVVAAEAKTYTYDIDKNRSQLNLTAAGSFLGGVLNVSEQQEGPVTKYDGSLQVEYPGGPWSDGSIRLPGGSMAEADVMRGWFGIPHQISPAIGGGSGTDPANYGITMTAPVGLQIPPIPFPDPNNPIELGTFESVEVDMAIRDLVLDVRSGSTPIGIGAGGEFDASGGLLSGVRVGVESGYVDLSGAMVLQQENLITWGVALAGLESLAALVPDLGLDIEGHLLDLTIDVGLGTRIDLAGIPDFLTLPNGAIDPGLVEFDPVSQYSTLTLPVSLDLPDLGIPPELFDFDLGLDGQLVATATLPEPTSLLMLGLAGLGLFRRRRR